MEKKRSVFIFGGQGSQYYGMARDLYDSNNVFRDHMDYLDSIFSEKLHQSIIEEIYDSKGKHSEMRDLSYSHPAIFMVQYSLYFKIRLKIYWLCHTKDIKLKTVFV